MVSLTEEPLTHTHTHSVCYLLGQEMFLLEVVVVVVVVLLLL